MRERGRNIQSLCHPSGRGCPKHRLSLSTFLARQSTPPLSPLPISPASLPASTPTRRRALTNRFSSAPFPFLFSSHDTRRHHHLARHPSFTTFPMVEYVYARHDFVPEHEDEVTFRAGERIEVIERDDLYSDGWWQVRSLRSPLRFSAQMGFPFASLESPFSPLSQPTRSSWLSRGV